MLIQCYVNSKLHGLAAISPVNKALKAAEVDITPARDCLISIQVVPLEDLASVMQGM